MRRFEIGPDTNALSFAGTNTSATVTNNGNVCFGLGKNGGLGLPSYTTSLLPAAPATGTTAWDSTLGKLVVYNGSSYVPFNQTSTSTITTEGGSGIVGIAETYTSGITRDGNEITTTIYVDLTGLNSSAAADIIGDNGNANCHIGRIDFSESGAVVSGYLVCLETPATGEPDIDLYSATVGTGAEDTAVTDLTETALLNAGIDWTVGITKVLTAVPADTEYLYLVGSGGGTSATYTAGRFMVVLKGYLAP